MSARFWWVNHSSDCPLDQDSGHLWFGKRRKRSKANEPDRNVQRLLPGDVVLSSSAGVLAAVGVVLGCPRGQSEAGWSIPLRSLSLTRPLRPEQHRDEWAGVAPTTNSPLRATGVCNQRVVLAAVPPAMVTVLRKLIGEELDHIVRTITEAAGRSLADEAAEALIQQRSDIGPAQKADLLKARYGQGAFRENVEVHEQGCRTTGLLDRRHLRAVHIKPWCECDDGEKLDGLNGLLMSPHLAHLFERGYVSFSDAGELLASQELNPAVLLSWGLELPRNVGAFAARQCHYLEYHRRAVFARHGGGRRQQSAAEHIGVPVPLEAEPATVNPA